ncbi:MAG: hypothetical protein LBJ17_04415, partial [Dysgonamonadaceae bacterium]|nr:hypothetical protein [Dysgonamonadaceae bacterium]
KTFHQIKKEIEPIYHEIAAIINANALVNTDPGFEKIITRLNPEIDLLNKEFHHVRHNLSKAQPSKIPDQQYTGLPITPIPEVFLKTTDKGTIRLELGKDFNIRFKDNVEIGNATLTIHGKSSYKGKKTVTFTIERTLS